MTESFGEIKMNEVLENLPQHLMDLVIDQPYNAYTWQDHAVWRYAMRQNVKFLGKHAHGSYIEGLRKTGISIDSIPHMYGMNRILQEIGWAAVSVDGFIPPQAFMEFQAYKVLVIAADIRNVDHIEYTPAPDIIHEAAGHAPIIADPTYAEYLRLFGEIGSKAFSSAQDYALYEAVRHLSIIKENPHTTAEQVEKAERELEAISNNMGEPSEMSRIRNLHWWTVEYGLIGDLNDYKIYGAGLLSSRGESVNCMDDSRVKKRMYSIEAANFSFDITTEQPQLFVAKSFDHLTEVLMEFSETMAYKRGGVYGLQTFMDSKGLGTAVFNNGVGASGKLVSFRSEGDTVEYIQLEGPTQLTYKSKEIEGHHKDNHAHGYGCPVGPLDNALLSSSTPWEVWEKEGFVPGAKVTLLYKSGVQVSGVFEQVVLNDAQEPLVLTWSNCTVRKGNDVLFDPEWGQFDLIIGESIESCYSGPADPKAYGLQFEPPKERTLKINYTDEDKKKHRLYGRLRKIRDKDLQDLRSVWEQSKELEHDWLLQLELYEMAFARGEDLKWLAEIKETLLAKSKANKAWSKLIIDGLELVESGFPLKYQGEAVLEMDEE